MVTSIISFLVPYYCFPVHLLLVVCGIFVFGKPLGSLQQTGVVSVKFKFNCSLQTMKL